MRPHTAPNNKLRSDESGYTSRNSCQVIFSGGQLRLTVLNAEKYTGNSRIVFGKGGRYVSKIQIFSLDEKIGESVVSHGGVDEDFQWAGYEDDLKLMSITYSPIIRLVVYDCERCNERQPLGWALVSLMDIPGVASKDYRVTTAIHVRSDVDSFDPKAVSIVGSITLKFEYDPYKVISLKQFQDHAIDIHGMSAIRFGFGWSAHSTDIDIYNGKYSAAVVMFDRNGKFIDAVDGFHPRAKRGPRSIHRMIPNKSDNSFADIEGVQVQLRDVNTAKQSRVFAYFVIITAKGVNSSLSDLSGGMYFRIVNGNNNTENCRYTVGVDEPTSACIMARVLKDPENSERWIVRPYGQLAFSERSYGTLIPKMRDLLGDVVPNCKGSGKDMISYGSVDRWIHISPLLAADLSSPPEAVPDSPPAEGEDSEEPVVSAVRQDITNISIGCNWLQVGDKLVDVDVGCLLIDADSTVADSVSLDKQRSTCGSVVQAIDDLEEEVADITTLDNRTLQVSLLEVPENISILAFYLLNLNVGESLGGIDCINAHVFETESKREVIMIDCPTDVNLKLYPTLLLCMLTRKEGQWYFVNSCKTSAVPDLLENGVYLDEYLRSSDILNKCCNH